MQVTCINQPIMFQNEQVTDLSVLFDHTYKRFFFFIFFFHLSFLKRLNFLKEISWRPQRMTFCSDIQCLIHLNQNLVCFIFLAWFMRVQQSHWNQNSRWVTWSRSGSKWTISTDSISEKKCFYSKSTQLQETCIFGCRWDFYLFMYFCTTKPQCANWAKRK